jgi:hypothetical protein
MMKFMIFLKKVAILAQPFQKVRVDALASSCSRDFIPGHPCKTLRLRSGYFYHE